jgi:hypothetical protein
MANREKAISAILANGPGFQGLSVSVSKPGYYAIVGRVGSADELNRLKADLRAAKVSKVILLVEVDDKDPKQ